MARLDGQSLRLNRHSAPERQRGEIEGGQVVLRESVVSGCDASELLELADGALDDVAPFIDGRVEVSRSAHARALRDDGPGADRLEMVEDGMGVIGLVGDDMVCSKAGDERQGIGRVAGLAAGEEEADRPAEAVDRYVPFARQSSSGTPQSLVFDPPFWPVAAWAWARTMALSIIRYWLSRSLVRALNTRSHTPARAQRVKRL